MTIQEIMTQNDNFCDLLPKNTKIHLTKGNQALFIVEFPPVPRTIVFDGERIKIHPPYLQFVFYVSKSPENYWITDILHFATPKPLTFKSALYHSPMPNTFNNNRVCLGDYIGVNKSCKVLIENICESYWQSLFTSELTLFYGTLHPENLKKYTYVKRIIKNFDAKHNFYHLFKKYHSPLVKIIKEENGIK